MGTYTRHKRDERLSHDMVLIIKARTKDDLENRVNDSLERANRWMKRRHLRLAAENTEAVYLTGKKKDQRGASF